MPISKTKMKNAAIAAKSAALPKIPKELLDQFVSGPMTGEAVNAASMAFKKALIERALGAELGHHLGYSNGTPKPEAVSNQRNGTSGKTVLTEDGPLRIEVPRDRDASFEPLLIPKHERRFTGFDDKIIAMEMLKTEAGIDMLHVPCKGSPPMIQDLIAGRVQFAFEVSSAILPHVKSGRCQGARHQHQRALGVSSGSPDHCRTGIARF